jgi:hypothetical protein
MDSILIDYTNIVMSDMKNLIIKLEFVPKTKYYLGLIIIIPSYQKKILERKKIGKDRVQYINDIEFVNSITNFFFVIYDKNKKICEIRPKIGVEQEFTNIISTIYSGIPSDTTIWIGFNTDDKLYIQSMVKEGFAHPYICKKSPLGYNFKNFGLCLFRDNNKNTIFDKESITNEIKYVIKQYNNNQSNNCCLYLKFTTNTIKKLKKLTNEGHSKNKNGTTTQKELGGSLSVFKISKINNKIVYIVKINKITPGTEEEVTIKPSRYNFHSHPKEAYVRHSVQNGWPSYHDYQGFLKLKQTIFHCVSTIEGMYIISLNKNWKTKTSKIDNYFIKKWYNIDHEEKISPKQYITIVNKIKYKNKKFPLFNVQYIPWSKGSEIITISYNKIGYSCLATDASFKTYNKYN